MIFWAAKANSHLEYVSIPVEMNQCLFHGGSFPVISACQVSGCSPWGMVPNQDISVCFCSWQIWHVAWAGGRSVLTSWSHNVRLIHSIWFSYHSHFVHAPIVLATTGVVNGGLANVSWLICLSDCVRLFCGGCSLVVSNMGLKHSSSFSYFTLPEVFPALSSLNLLPLNLPFILSLWDFD